MAAGLRLVTLCLPGNESEKRPGLGRHTKRLNKNSEWSVQRDAGGEGRRGVGGGVQGGSGVIALAPVGQGANTGVNELRISSNTHLLILIGMPGPGMPLDMLLC